MRRGRGYRLGAMTEAHPIPISVVRLDHEVEELVLSVIRSGTIAQGPMVKRLEDRFAEMIGAKHVVAVNNGTTALIAALQVLDLEPGDEVITSPFTFVATLNAILGTGAVARFADISPDDFNVTADSMSDVVSNRTRVLLPVHLYGQCADMPAIQQLADVNSLAIVEDAAQAHGAAVAGKSAGTWGTGCFSLYATKNLTSAEGGLISTNDDDLADKLRVLRNQGMRARYEYEMAGNNYRLTDLHAAVCVPQLEHYATQVAARQANAAALYEGLAGIDGVRLPEALPNRDHVWHQYTIVVEPGARINRDQLIDGLTQRGIGCGKYYPKLVFDYDCYRNHPNVRISDVPVAAGIAAGCVSIPVHQYLSHGELDRVISGVRECFGE